MNNCENFTIKEVLEGFEERVLARFDKVDQAQAHTNGNVRRLQMWRAFITGGLLVISAMVIPLVIYVWNQNRTQMEASNKLTNNNQVQTTYK